MTRILYFIILIFISHSLLADTINVCGTCAYKSITQAVNDASDGDTILVESGTYYESNIVIDKRLAIIGLSQPVIDAEENGFIFDVSADSIVVKGFTLNNVGKSYTKDYSAIHTYNADNFVIEDNVFNNPFFAIHIERSKNGIIRNNEINGVAKEEHNSGNGIHLWHSAKIRVNNNTIEGMRDGIYLEFVKNSEVMNNISINNLRYGLHFMFSNDDKYEDNLFENNGAGVAVMFSKYIYMRNNIFRYNWGTASYGLLLKEINDAFIYGNVFEQNTIGINAEGSNRVSYENNTFSSNGWAIKFLGACYGNKLHRNNFMYNAFDISYNGGINGNLIDKNYWSEYTGYDLDKNNIGDVPYRPIKLFSYVVNRTPETIILLRSLFVDIINFSEKVSPMFTPDNLKDYHPLMKPVQ
jgi:nitrous oxidase accessory protein